MISVVLSTRDRPNQLRSCLETLAAAERPTQELEIIVVDNGGDERTALVCRQAMQQGMPLRIVRESRPGLSHARNHGVREARGDLLAFTDDDCLVAPDWLRVVEREFANPLLEGFGGRVDLHDPEDLSVTILPVTDRTLVTGLGSLFLGCNMALRRSVFDRIGPFDPLLGAGSPTLSGEDGDFIVRAVLKGIRLETVPDLVVRHAHGRRSEEELASLNRGYVIGRGAFYFKHIVRGSGHVIKGAASEIVRLAVRSVRPAEGPRNRRRARQRLGYLMSGASRYLRERFRLALARPGDRHSGES